MLPPLVTVHPIYVELHPPRLEKMRTAVRSTFALCTTVYTLTAVAGYLLFEEGVMGDVLANFDKPLHGKVRPVRKAFNGVGEWGCGLLTFFSSLFSPSAAE